MNLTGTGRLARLILRRDRVRMPIWVGLFGLVPINFVAATEQVLPNAAEQANYARTSGSNPTFLALYGPLHDVNLGAIITQRAGLLPVFLGLISALVVVRHTRTEEEEGRRELLGATVVGREAPLAAALLAAIAGNLVIAAVVTAGMAAQDLPLAGSLALGLQFALVGCAFAAVAGVTAQLSESAGTARGLAIGVLGVAFVLRMSADVGGPGNGLSWLSWLTPLGWGTRLRPYAGEQWWVIALFALLVAGLALAAMALSARRDIGAGILAARLGPADASPRLSGPFGLAWRLHSRPLAGWLAGLGALGIVYGAFGEAVQDMVDENEQLREVFSRLGGGRGIVDVYFTVALGYLGLIAAAYGVSAMLRARSEESSLRVEPVLGTRIGRLRWVASHLAFALLGSAAAMALCGFLAGLVHGLNADDVGYWLPRVLGASLAQLPAVWLVAALALALYGLVPRLGMAAWAVTGAIAVIALFGTVLDLDQWVLDLSPFSHIPQLPGGPLAVAPLAWLLGLSALLTAVGLVAFRRRDVPQT